MLMRFIGDIHANFAWYQNAIKDCGESIQLGDFGIGFESNENPIPVVDQSHGFIRGNHDDPAKCRAHGNWIPDGYYDQYLDIFFIGGAYSTDKHLRTPGVDWWSDEQLSKEEFGKHFRAYRDYKPKYVVSHDCPASILPVRYYDFTKTLLDELFKEHQPKLWIFGHHHRSWLTQKDSTTFLCVNKLSYVDIDINRE